jgi:hypothetical protein
MVDEYDSGSPGVTKSKLKHHAAAVIFTMMRANCIMLANLTGKPDN